MSGRVQFVRNRRDPTASRYFVGENSTTSMEEAGAETEMEGTEDLEESSDFTDTPEEGFDPGVAAGLADAIPNFLRSESVKDVCETNKPAGDCATCQPNIHD
ncbi:MAG: hypothetical protein GY721_00545, partial [Deltaproteobacteria bacterium]|nr:hypothetical protein [Deltaproteobacteria bacterium]